MVQFAAIILLGQHQRDCLEAIAVFQVSTDDSVGQERNSGRFEGKVSRTTDELSDCNGEKEE